ncbi:N-acetylglucosamine-6-phosphate deacetylase [Oceanirhabdus sp. W0125-5]|uniref:N-acetylglucosamine-6-phosphate deacetylase n=1 Tax=Oceanirhabdus sp. W0125-5 TaxID=2999116 RepID=UPI0022F33347|nr:N-acetylglucosamine-6-phosphate deacetylase [Oceanirhabdus sp. W0125-5]WBW95299.1 N-acetylglucosamine-6-phosphate deacetylase [Oceanirhabdus sp. W0125-5]
MRAITNGRIITEEKILEDYILLFSDRIEDIIPQADLRKYHVKEIIDAKGNYVSPGLMDLHIHGAGGFDTMDGTFEALNTISKVIAKEGVTSFLPTTMTMAKEKIITSINNIRENKNKVQGAKILGCHVEGPFISKKYKGAQCEEYIIKPDESLLEGLTDIIKIITIAPEEDVENRFIKAMKKKGIVLSVGHSNATFDETIQGIEDGISYATHTFNGMRGLHHREPGVVGAVFSKDIYCELIADMIHVHKGFFEGFIKINGMNKVILISDSMRAGCMECGEYELGGQKVFVDESSARLEDGTLAGSVLKLKDAVKNIKDNTSYELKDIIKMASLNCANVLGLENELGSIKKGKLADIILFNEEFQVNHTIIQGKSVYKR